MRFIDSQTWLVKACIAGVVREQIWWQIRIQHVEKPPCAIFLEQSGQPVAFDSILQFSLLGTCMWFWEAAPIITYTKDVILGSNFRYQNQEINHRILIKCARDDIARKHFQNNVTMKENKIQNLYTEFNRVWIENHVHVSSSKNCNMLSNATGCPNCFKNLHRGVSQHAESKFAIRSALTTPAIQALILYCLFYHCSFC